MMDKKLIIKKLKYKLKYSGLKETDYIFQLFSEQELDNLSLNQLIAFEELLNYGDKIILDWILKNELPEKQINKSILLIIKKIKKLIKLKTNKKINYDKSVHFK